MEKTIIEMERFALQVKALFATLGITLSEYGQSNARSKRGKNFDYTVYTFEHTTPNCGVITGTVYEDWVHIRIDNTGLDYMKENYPESVGFGPWFPISLSGKWNAHWFNGVLEDYIITLQERFAFLLEVEQYAKLPHSANYA